MPSPKDQELAALADRCGFKVVGGNLAVFCRVPLPGREGHVMLMASAPLGPLYRTLLARLNDPQAAATAASKLAASSGVQKIAQAAKRIHGNLAPVLAEARAQGPAKLLAQGRALVARAKAGDPKAASAVARLKLAVKTKQILDDKGREAAAKLAPVIEQAKKSPAAKAAFVRGVKTIAARAQAGDPKAKKARGTLKLAARYRARMSAKAKIGGWAWNVPYRASVDGSAGRLRSLYARGME